MVIALAAGLVALAAMVVALVLKLRRSKSIIKSTNDEIGVDHAPNGHQYVNEKEAIDANKV